MASPREFLLATASDHSSALERALGLLYIVGADDPSVGMTARQICDCFFEVGHARQNVSRLDAALHRDRRTIRAGINEWRLSAKARLDLAETFSFVAKPKALPDIDSVLPHGIFDRRRGYINRVVQQLNQSYDLGLFDCTAVMCRRLLETLIIEVYERSGRADELHGSDGHFMMLSGLLTVLEKDKTINFSRNGQKGLKDFKSLGDLSAHSRRFNAQKSDIDRIRDGLRVATEELLHLAHLHSSVASQ